MPAVRITRIGAPYILRAAPFFDTVKRPTPGPTARYQSRKRRRMAIPGVPAGSRILPKQASDRSIKMVRSERSRSGGTLSGWQPGNQAAISASNAGRRSSRSMTSFTRFRSSRAPAGSTTATGRLRQARNTVRAACWSWLSVLSGGTDFSS